MRIQHIRDSAASQLFTVLRTDQGSRASYPLVGEPGRVEGQQVTTVSLVQPVDPKALVISRLERHPHCHQTFIPLDVSRWLIAVAPDDESGNPDLGRLYAYLAGPGDAICLHRNTWHMTLTVFDRPAEMIMMMWRAASFDDTQYFELPEPISLA